MAELEISERAIGAVVMAPVQADAITDMLAVAAPIIVAAELRRLYEEMPVAGRWFLVDRAAELDPEGNTP